MAYSPSSFLRTAVMAAAASALLFYLAVRHPEYLRGRTLMEMTHPVCVLGVAEPTGTLSKEKAGIRNLYLNWKTSFPSARVHAIRDSGAIPLITWEPYRENIKQDKLLSAIADGRSDAYISRFAALSVGGPLLIRFAHEPNGDWYGWSGVNSNPELYIRAFRRVKEVFSRYNKEARFIFSVNSEDVPEESWNRFENYYPGDEYADVIGIDAYNWGDGTKSWRKWRKPRAMLADVYERTVKAFPSKPVIITETASCPNGGDKAAWISQLLRSIGGRFPAVKGIVWFDFKKECDWSLQPGPVRSEFYGACGTGRFSCSAAALDWLFKGTR